MDLIKISCISTSTLFTVIVSDAVMCSLTAKSSHINIHSPYWSLLYYFTFPWCMYKKVFFTKKEPFFFSLPQKKLGRIKQVTRASSVVTPSLLLGDTFYETRNYEHYTQFLKREEFCSQLGQIPWIKRCFYIIINWQVDHW